MFFCINEDNVSWSYIYQFHKLDSRSVANDTQIVCSVRMEHINTKHTLYFISQREQALGDDLNRIIASRELTRPDIREL